MAILASEELLLEEEDKDEIMSLSKTTRTNGLSSIASITMPELSVEVLGEEEEDEVVEEVEEVGEVEVEEDEVVDAEEEEEVEGSEGRNLVFSSTVTREPT